MRFLLGQFFLLTTIAAAASASTWWQPSVPGESPSSIVGGDISFDPNTVLLLLDGQPHCSGVLVSPSVILTAAHCLFPHAIDDVRRFRAVFPGMHDDDQAGHGYDYRIHPKWPKSHDNDFDIAVLAVSRVSATYAHLPHRVFDRIPSAAVAVGYGITDKGAADIGIQRIAHVEVKDYERRSLRLGGAAIACNGDSGGPLYASLDGMDVVLGIHTESNCEDSFWDTRVDTHFQSFVRPFLLEVEGNPCVADDTCMTQWVCSKAIPDPDCQPGQCATDGVCDTACYRDRDCLCPEGGCDGALMDTGGCMAERSGATRWTPPIIFFATLMLRRRRRRHTE